MKLHHISEITPPDTDIVTLKSRVRNEIEWNEKNEKERKFCPERNGNGIWNEKLFWNGIERILRDGKK